MKLKTHVSCQLNAASKVVTPLILMKVDINSIFIKNIAGVKLQRETIEMLRSADDIERIPKEN